MATLGIPQNTIAVLQKYHFNFQKKFGQNFLIDPHVLEKIVEAAGVTKDDFVLEIGPGIGTMTQYLCENAREVTAVEIDTNLIPILEDTLSAYDNVTVINQDILKLDIAKLAMERNGGKPIKVVANLPYYITSPVIMMLLESEIPVEAITVMVQKEAAQRLCAKMGTRESGAITAAVNYYGSAKLLFHVSRGSFMPAPNVDSAVIQIRPDSKYRDKIQDKALYFKVIKGAFAQRRKTLANSLSSSMEISKEEIYGLLEQCGLEKNSRCEQLTMENWTDFVNLLKNSI